MHNPLAYSELTLAADGGFLSAENLVFRDESLAKDVND